MGNIWKLESIIKRRQEEENDVTEVRNNHVLPGRSLFKDN